VRGRWSTHRTHGAQATHRNDTPLSELFRVTGLGRTVSRRPTRDLVTASAVALTGPSGILTLRCCRSP
jgi:hypothetical protein